MPLPRYASKGAIRFLARYVRRRFFYSHSVVILAVARRGRLQCRIPVCGQASGGRSWHPSAASRSAMGCGGDSPRARRRRQHTLARRRVGLDARLCRGGRRHPPGVVRPPLGQGTKYFIEQFPGALAGRITAAANAAWLIESSLTWTTIPPGVAVIASILVLGTINWHLTAVLLAVVCVLGAIIAWWAAHGRSFIRISRGMRRT